jgi:uncharacterized membrane protein YkoI
MNIASKFVIPFLVTGALMLGVGVVPASHAGTLVTPEAQAKVITKLQAEQIALKAVGGGTVVSAILEKEDGRVHWSIDIVGTTLEHEVWVSTAGKVLKIITQPL